MARLTEPVRWVAALLLVTALFFSRVAIASGTWTALTNPAYGQSAMLMSDGTVMVFDGGSGVQLLIPDHTGSYVNGTWKKISSMHASRLYFSSDVLTNGNVYAEGGEYAGPGTLPITLAAKPGRVGEIYSPLTGLWMLTPSFAGGYDCQSEVLPNGNVLQDLLGNAQIYNVASNTVGSEFSMPWDDEGAWVKLGDGRIFGINGSGGELFIPSVGHWISDAAFPTGVTPWGPGGEMGAAFLLPNGKVLVTGATTNTCLYTPDPGGGTNPGTWAAGPAMSGDNSDKTAFALPSGNVIINTSAGWQEYAWSSNTLSTIASPPGGGFESVSLPDGSTLVVNGNNASIYFPNESPVASAQPTISSIAENGDGSYHLIGSQLSGINEGACGGSDDTQAASNYPLVRLTNNATGNVYYARTYGWNNTGVLNSANEATTTEFALPPNLPAGTYSLVVSANGNPSAAQSFNYSPLSAPTGVTPTSGNGQVALTWNLVSGATSYNVMRSVFSGGTPYYLPVTNTTGTSFTDTGLSNGLTYYYVVTAVGSGGVSALSTEVSSVPNGPAATPTGITASGVTALAESGAEVSITWNGNLGDVKYNIKRSTTSGGPYAVIGTLAATSGLDPYAANNYQFIDANLTAGQTYYYVVSAANQFSEGANCPEMKVSTLVSPWASSPIHTFISGGASYSGGAFTTMGCGADIGNTSDQFQYVYQLVSSDCDIRARVTSQSNTDPWAKAGVMIRETLDPGATFAAMFITPGNGFRFVDRTTTGGSSPSSTSGGALNASPNNWVRVTRSGSTYTAYASADGSNWTTVATASITMASNVYIGLAVSSHDAGVLGTATFDQVTTSGGSAPTPGVPANVYALGGNGQVNVTWNSDAASTSYNVKRATASGGAYTTIANVVETNFVDANVTPGNSYYYVVSGVDAGAESANSAQASVGVLVPPWMTNDVNSPATSGGAGEINGVFTINGAGSDISSTSDQFQYLNQPISGNCDIRARVTSQSNTDPWAKTGVMIRETLAGNSTFAAMFVTPGNGFRFINRPTTGGACPSSVSGGALNAFPNNWVRITRSGSTFTGYASADGVSWTQVSSATISMASTVLVGLPVCSHSTSTLGTAAIDNVSGVPTLAGPGGLNAEPGNGQVNLTWNAVNGASGYNIKRSTTSGGPYTIIATASATSYGDVGLTNGTTYYYVVSAVNGNGEGSNSSQVGAEPVAPPAAPANLVPTAGNGQISLTWSAPSGATSYNVKRSTTTGGPYTTVASPTSASYTDAGLTNGTTYYYVVSAVNVGGESSNSGQVSATPEPPIPPAPTGLSAIAGNAQVSLNWNASSGATSYNVKRSTTSGGPYSTAASPSSTNYVDTGLSNGTTYFYVVSAVNGGGESANSSQVSAAPEPPIPPAPTGLTATVGSAQVSLSWGASTGATSYNVKRATTSGGPYTTVTSPTGTSYTDTGLTNGTTYYYVVSAVNVSGESGNSSEKSATPEPSIPPTPTGLVVKGGNTQATLSWNASSGAASYNVKRATTSGGPYTTVSSPAGTNDVDSGLTAGATYYYVVSAVNAGGESANCAQASVGILPSPWVTADIGSVGAAGSATYSGGVFSVNGAGSDISNTSDSFQFTYQAFTGDCDIRARVTSESNTDPWAKAGVMIRETLNGNATFAMMVVTPGNGFRFMNRPTTGAACPASVSGGALNASPNNWVRVTRSGNTFTGYASADGASWTSVGSVTIAMAESVYIGMPVCSHSTGTLGTATFDNLSTTQLPLPWSTADVGTVGTTGSATYSSGVFTVKGGGSDISSTADSFRYLFQTASGDCDIRARVTFQSNTDPWAKAGVMIRETLNSNATFAMMVITPGNGFRFMNRPTTGAACPASVSGGALNTSPNNWVRVTRSGNTFTGYVSADGSNWTSVGSATITMATNVSIGMPVCSRVSSTLGTGTFDNTTATP